ncbi:MAG TPA: ATP-binding protein [Chloroflexota bacterium]|nr:ATP-binding protein [Chloroflexota bacterium]
MSLRNKILLAMLATLLIGDLLGTWVVRDRIEAGMQREAANQAFLRARQVQSLYAERAATLQAESEAISLYPAVIAALVGNNPAPLRTWSSQVAGLQGTSVTVTDPSGTVVARGHAPDLVGDNVAPPLAGLQRALAGEKLAATESGDELQLALRGYAPVLREGIKGDIVGAVMIADPIDDRFLKRLAGGDSRLTYLRVIDQPAARGELCSSPPGAVATCAVPLLGVSSEPIGYVAFDVQLADIERAQAEAERGLWLASAGVLVLGALAAWLLARSLTRPLERLTHGAQRIAHGEFDQPVAVQGSDEIGHLATAFEVMRGRVAQMTGTLRDERDVLDAVLDSAGDGIIMVDQGGHTVVANYVWSYLAGGEGLAAASALKRADAGEQPESFAQLTQRWLSDPQQVAVADFERGEPYQRFRVYSAPVRHHGGAILGRIVVLRDVTRETEVERMRAALIASVSHELRSPLTAISGYTDTLLHDGPWDADTQREFLEVVSVSAGRLAALVDNLLDAATLEAGGLRLQREPVRLERVAERVLNARRLLAGSCTLHLETRPGLPLADADPIRVEQVMANLVENAIKYSPSGGAVQMRIRTDADGMLSVSVADQGVGIAHQHLAHVFERFYRVESGGRSVRGVGLGLYICRSLVESHGGRIWVDSQPGLGSTFAFTLPALTETAEEEPTPRGAIGVAAAR